MVVERAHNEYVQILAELGIVGFALFLAFCVALIIAAWRALRYSQSALAPGACCSLIAFALSSGASSASFRWMGGGLIFFFAAALVSHFGARQTQPEKRAFKFVLIPARLATAVALALALLMLGGRGAQATSTILHGAAQRWANSPAQAEQFFRGALALNPFDAATHFDYGLWLYYERRASEAVPHLRYATERGINVSVCYAYLAAAEAGSGDTIASAATLAHAVNVYPRSVFLRVRHSVALKRAGRAEAAAAEFDAALSLDARTARGWLELMSVGVDEAKVTAHNDKSVAMPGELYPENCIFAVIAEFELSRSGLTASAGKVR
jgi:tetratricopeptide (TPR) repeat protein